MKWLWRILRAVLIGLVLGGVMFVLRFRSVEKERISEVRNRVEPVLNNQLARTGFALGDPVFIRIFKESKDLEVWLKPSGSAVYRLYRTYPIAYFSGGLGPKLAEGDMQAPEGFYSVSTKQLNPKSSFHLAINIGYPNDYDRAQGRTGSDIMVHGDKVSIGCFAMTDPLIEEIYLIVEAALKKGQSTFSVHVFPFRMSGERLDREAGNPWFPYWQNLREGYELFEQSRVPPMLKVAGGRYVFE